MLLDRWMGRLGRHPPRLRQARALNVNVRRRRQEGGEINGGTVVGVGAHPPNQSESWQFNYKEIKGHSSFN